MGLWCKIITLADGAQCVVMREGSNSLRYFFRVQGDKGHSIETNTSQEFDSSYVPTFAFDPEFETQLQEKAQQMYDTLLGVIAMHEDVLQPGHGPLIFEGNTIEQLFMDQSDAEESRA